jgi:hypothetical protein
MLLDQTSLGRLLNRADVGNQTAYDSGYIAGVIADAQSAIAGYLGYDPVLAVVEDEEGAVEYVQSGVYVGRYALSLAHAPLIPGPAPTVFSSLQLTYGLATLPASGVDFSSITLLHSVGRAFTLAPGAVEALTWQYGLTPGVRAVGYIATYVAGYATGINDPVPSGGGSGFAATATLTNGSVSGVTVTSGGSGYTDPPLLVLSGGGGNGAALEAEVSAAGIITSVGVLQGGQGYASAPTIGVSGAATYNAPPMPGGITQAAVLLCRERIAMDDAANTNTTNPLAGMTTVERTADQERRYQPLAKTAALLGYGTPLAQAAAHRLNPYRRITLPMLL